jgi:excisionase family DNA binding protein
MNKTEAAQFLGVSVRTLERHVANGELSVTYTRGAHGRERTFDQTELSRFKASLDTTTYVARPVATDASNEKRVALAPVRSEAKQMLALIQSALSTNDTRNSESVSDIAAKLILTLPDAARLSSLSVNHLREAIKEKHLKARIIGRGWKIKRVDLDAYVRKL